LASALMAAALWLARESGPFLLLPLGAVVYGVALVALGTFRDPDLALVLQLVPTERWLARLPLIRRTT
jgi:hypothetical protein